MRFLTNGLSGREPLLINPAQATDHANLAKQFGFTDIISQLFGVAPKPYVVGNIGVIPVVGVIGKGLSPLEKMMGSVDIDEISDAIDKMDIEPGVEKIAFHISSPGGTVTGVEELANKIRNLDKPTMAYSDSEMASAAYWIGSAADRLVVAPSSTIGSIGVYQVIPDFSGLYEASGIKQVVIKAGKLKGMGIEGTSLTQDQIDNLQAGVDEIWGYFKEAVKMKRKMVADDSMEGQVFSGKVAASKYLATGLADNFSTALASF